MHESATGRRHTLETRMKISRRMKDVHAQRKAAKMWVTVACSPLRSAHSSVHGKNELL